MTTSPYWNIDDLTARFKCSKRTLYRWMALELNPMPKPKIEQIGVSSLWLIDDIIQWEDRMSDAA
jgi:predicted DNA-binding transcriptional regulator AlpA